MIKKTLALLLLTLLGPLAVSHGQQPAPADLGAAHDAWFAGQYRRALTVYLRLLRGPQGDQFVEPIARQTGELFQTDELTTDGRVPRLSPDGSVIAYETGPSSATKTRLLELADGHAFLADLPGSGAVFSPTGLRVAYLKVPSSDQLKQAQAVLDNPATQGVQRIAAQQTVNYLQAKLGVIVVRHVGTQTETVLDTGSLLKGTMVFGADDKTLYFAGAKEGEAARNDIYAVSEATPPVIVSDAGGFKNAPQVAPDGKTLLVTVPAANPFAPPRNPGAGQGGRGQGGGGGGGGGQFTPGKFGLLDLASHKLTVISGSGPAFAPDGRAVAYITRTPQEQALVLHPLGGEPVPVLKTSDRLDAPAFSPDGQRLAYQKMSREDWELFVIGRDGQHELRLTREIQHDVAPRFLTNTRVLGLVGEPRHRRAYLHDLSNNTHTQLFHNNSVRTISPEYAWQPTPDGKKLLIQADRDGDTVSTERGVFLVQLDRPVTKAQLLARLEKNLAAETALYNAGQRQFAPLAAQVRRVVAQASTERIYGYEKALFDFDSKHITKPGNQQAAEFLRATYQSFGYAAELQCFEPRQALGGKTCNVIAKLPGTANPELIYVVSSHYDSVAIGPGADDDSSGTAALLEAARMLAQHPQPATIVFASFTGEEAGLLGSREFVRVAQAEKWQIVGALNNDMIGWANDNRLDNTIRYSNDSIRDIQHAAAFLFTRLITFDARYHKSTDATAFFEAYGDIVGGIGSYPVLGNPRYHQATDLLETINHQLITETSKTTAATLMLLAASPARLKELQVARFDGQTAELSWTPAPEKGVTGYLVSYGEPAKTIKVLTPRVTLHGVAANTVVKVKAVNARGLEGWDWARVTLAK
jgi:hypothetical protein